MNKAAGSNRWWMGIGLLLVLLVGGVAFERYGRSIWVPVKHKIMGRQTVEDVLVKYGEPAEARLRPHFEEAGVYYPPHDVILLGIKADSLLELWARTGEADPYRLVHSYLVKGQSGTLGPKLREGDKQVPEGLYNIEGLNPNSSYHLSMKLNYPNAFDLARAEEDGRTSPGSNIFIHGKALSVGCLAMGDPAIEELFVMVARIGTHNTEVIITPRDPRREGWNTPPADSPSWTAELYDEIRSAVMSLTIDEGQ